MEPVELTDGRVLLRLPADRDVDAIYAACQDAEIQRFTSVPVPYLRVHAEGWVRDSAASWARAGELGWVVTDASTGVFLGNIGLHVGADNGIREIGFLTAPQARGKGYTTAAVRLVCRWGFEQLELSRIEWLAAVDNAGSWRVAEKVGFIAEGTLRARMLQRGVRHDARIAGLLPPELT